MGTFGSGGLALSAPAASAIAASLIGSALGIYVYNNYETWIDWTFNSEAVEEKDLIHGPEPMTKPPYSGAVLGDDPTICPGEGFEWRGRGTPESCLGSWFNPKTKERLYPDFNHPPPKGPHWDYKHEREKFEARLFLDGTWELK